MPNEEKPKSALKTMTPVIQQLANAGILILPLKLIIHAAHADLVIARRDLQRARSTRKLTRLMIRTDKLMHETHKALHIENV